MNLKPPKPKVRRRGARLVITCPDNELYVFCPHSRGVRRVIEFGDVKGRRYDITYSAAGHYAKMTPRDPADPAQCIYNGGFFGDLVAFRPDESYAWGFVLRSEGERVLYTSVAQAPFANAALAAGMVTAEIDEELATFLGVARALCPTSDVIEVRDSPRYKALLDFEFDARRPAAGVGTGRRAENTVRHQYSNYDAMLRAAGGLLWPEVYERVRAGTDRIVRELIQEGA